jgi:DNA-binding transcriptional MerR regulator/effector-binding domain-containing protein
MFSIGEFARLGQVSVKMLRHYDGIGLLRPAMVDPATGYRYYTAAQLPAIGRIVALRDLGFGLREIAALAGRAAGLTDSVVASAYLARERQLRDCIRADRARLRRLTASRAALARGAQTEVLVRATAAQVVAICASRDFAALERRVARLGGRADGAPMTLIGEQVLAAVPVRGDLARAQREPDRDGVAVRSLPAVPAMACLLHLGSYAGLAASWQALLGWVSDVGAEPGQLREVYLSFRAEDDLALRADYLTGSPASFVTELQVPMPGPPGGATSPECSRSGLGR